MRMPKMAGPETCAIIRQSSDVPIIMFTSTNDAADVKHAIVQGATDFVLKSTGMSELTDRIAFHLQKMEDQAAKTAPANQKSISATPTANATATTTTVLIVDPSEEARGVIKAVLTRLNQNVFEVSTALEAIGAFSQHNPDIVITEWKLPDMDASKMFAAFESQKNPKKLLKLMMSNRLTPEAVRKAHYVGVTNFLYKPLDLAKVEIMVADCVRSAIRGIKKRSRKAA